MSTHRWRTRYTSVLVESFVTFEPAHRYPIEIRPPRVAGADGGSVLELSIAPRSCRPKLSSVTSKSRRRNVDEERYV